MPFDSMPQTPEGEFEHTPEQCERYASGIRDTKPAPTATPVSDGSPALAGVEVKIIESPVHLKSLQMLLTAIGEDFMRTLDRLDGILKTISENEISLPSGGIDFASAKERFSEFFNTICGSLQRKIADAEIKATSGGADPLDDEEDE